MPLLIRQLIAEREVIKQSPRVMIDVAAKLLQKPPPSAVMNFRSTPPAVQGAWSVDFIPFQFNSLTLPLDELPVRGGHIDVQGLYVCIVNMLY